MPKIASQEPVIDPPPPIVRRWRHGNSKFPAFGWAYLDHLIGQYKQMEKRCDIVDEIIRRRNISPEDLTWGDLYSLERILVASLTEDEVKRSLWATRFRLKQIAGGEAFEAYEKSHFPDEKASVEELRADLQRILELLHWYYSLLPLRNKMRIRYILTCIFWIIGYTFLLGILFFFSNRHPSWDSSVGLIASVLYFGIVGGYVSSLRRLHDVQLGEGDPIVGIYELKGAVYFQWLSPMLGAVFAGILTLLFAGGVLQGTIFPTFGAAASTKTLSDFVKNLQPTNLTSYALLLVWSFVAGFAERFVPDSLDTLIAGQKLKEAKKK